MPSEPAAVVTKPNPGQNSPPVAKKPGEPQAAERKQPAVPEDDFWRRYSPNHEFPLSSAASVVLHMFVVLMIALFARWATETAATTPEIEAIVFAGGGGDPSGNSLDLDAKSMPEAIEFDPSAKPVEDRLPPLENALTPSQNVRAIEKVETKTSDVLKRAKGLYGSGSGGGGMSGRGTGIGSGEDPGVETARARRLNRWDIRFEYTGGEDYLHQLKSLGAIIAVPSGDKYMLYRDINQRPARGELVPHSGLSKLNRIYWVNKDREAVDLLLAAMGVTPGPDRFWAFFPYEFEQDLAKKELAFRGRQEEDIKETIFKVVAQRGGKYTVQVASQTGR